MKRVRFIYSMKRAVNLVTPKIAVLAVFVVVASFFVSVPNVIRNMPNFFEIGRLFEFSVSAFLNTKFAIQAISVGTLMMVFYIARDIFKAFREGSQRVAMTS